MAIGVFQHSTLDKKIFDPFSKLGPNHFDVSQSHQKFEEIRTNCRYYSLPCNDETFCDQNFKIIHINTRSLLSDEKFEEFKTMLHRSCCKWDVICVSETWLDEFSQKHRFIDGYVNFFENRNCKIGGGVAIYILKTKVKETHQLSIHMSSTQSIFISLILKNNVSFIIGQIYRPPNLDQSVFIEDLATCLDSLPSKNKTAFICGDFNFDLFSTSHNTKVHDFFNTFTSAGFLPLISKTTRAQETCHTLLDNIFCNNISIIHKTGLLAEDISDHFPVFTCLNVKTPLTQDKPITFSKFDYSKIPELTEHLLHELRNFETITDPDIASETFVNAYISGIEKFSVKHKANRKVMALKPWVTPAILSSINRRNKLFVKKQKHPSQENIEEYSKYRNVLNAIIRGAKKMYIQQELNANKNNSKKIWDILLTHTRGQSTSHHFPGSFYDGEEHTITDHNLIANKFNLFFSTVGEKLQESIPISPNDPLQYLQRNNINLTGDIGLTTPDELSEIIKHMKNVGGGNDGINAKIFKATFHDIIFKLTYLINLCLSHGKFPKNMKIAIVKPVYKSGDKQQMSNYRPISILPYISKLIEKIIYTRLMAHLNDNLILSDYQFGFRKKISTYMPLMLIHDKITKALENNKILCGLYLDLKKAFDTVDHNILLSKLSAYGISGNFLNVIKSYLSDREQFVQYQNAKSSCCKIHIGVPQGSILGPLLFIIYVNDFPNICNASSSYLYADDTAIFF